MAYDVIVVGGGISGLRAAEVLLESGANTLLLEQNDAVGGRIQTDLKNGFQLDRGFQILLPAYEEAKAVFEYRDLDLRYFRRGARVHLAGKWEELRDPMDAPWRAMMSVFSKIGTFKDKLGIAYLQTRALKGTLKGDENKTTLEYLKGAGFSDQILKNFFQPFFGGVFLEKDLTTSSKDFAFYFSMFSLEGGAIPAKGMQSLPKQLEERIPEQHILLKSPVDKVLPGEVHLRDGSTLNAKYIILAVDENALRAILPEGNTQALPRMLGTTCMYFSGPPSLGLPPLLHLVPNSANGISNIAPLSSVAREYAPSGETLFSVSLTHESNGECPARDEEAVRTELMELFGGRFEAVEHQATYTIQHALPSQKLTAEALSLPPQILLAGDVSEQGSINGALVAGKKAAEQVIAELKQKNSC